jgi:glycosyltransferase involved in cell wall biosynthesis
MKKIVFVIESLHLGGAEKSLITLLQNIDYTVFSVDLILFKEQGIFFKSVPNDVRIIQKEFPNVSVVERVIFKLLQFSKGARYHNAQLFWQIVGKKFTECEEKYEVAIAYNQGFATYYTERYITATKKYSWLNTDYQKAGYNITFDYPIYKKFTQVIAVSPQAKNSLVKSTATIKRSLSVETIKDITDEKMIQEMSLMEVPEQLVGTTITIVTVARLVPIKGIAIAIESCRILLDKGYDLRWYVVGEGTERIALETLIKKYKLEKFFILLGAHDNPYPFMKMATIYVQTSLFEGLGLTVIEASYLNKPIVSTNFPTVYDVITDGKTGFIAEMNPQSISNQIEKLLINPSLRATFTANLSVLKNADKAETLKKIAYLFNA